MFLVMLVPQFLTYRIEHIVTATILSINTLFLSNSVLAQIIPDGTLNTQVNFVDGQQKITGGIESRTNLFHSFKEFSPTADFVTNFDNNNYIQNIFTRVTGGSTSLIDGLIRTNGSASLFILNPAGIIFGNNAQLDIGGSFITTTAESIIFTDGTKFDTQLAQTPPLLTVSIPSGLQYGNSPGAISSNNTEPINLDVSPENNISPGNTIAFLGGNIELQNISIKSFSGNVEIGSVAEGEIVSLFPINNGFNNGWEFNYANVGNFNIIKITQDSQINASGKLGNINLRGKDIFLNTGLRLENSTNTDIDGGNISLLATNYIDLNDIILSTQVERFYENRQLIQHSVKGKGGDIIISAKDIKIGNGSIISASSLNQGDGGNIMINASESLELSGFSEFIPSLIITSVDNSGAGGTIEINTGKLVITDGALIESNSFGTGKAGTITVDANESILISGSRFSDIFNQEFSSGFSASSGFEGLPLELQIPNLGASGSITVNTPRLSIEDGGEISVSNFGMGNAGDITINARELLLNNDSQITAITASGDGGSINFNSSEIVLRDKAAIATTADGNGNGGNITMKANNIVLFDESNINADANLGSGGNIKITTQSLLTQKNPEDAVTASSERGIDGIVEIKTPDTNSKLETTQVKRSPLAAEESIYTGCGLGTDFEANKFSYIGRGGIRKSPFESVETQEVIGDLGLEESVLQAAELNTNKNPDNNIVDKTPKSIIEATAWVVNAQGNVELIAQASHNPLPSGCIFK